MRFKDDEIKRQWETQLLHPKLRDELLVLDGLAQICGMEGGLMLTSIYRPDDAFSYHKKWQAVDIRDKDWDKQFMRLFTTVIISIKRWNPQAQFELEPSPLHPDSAPHAHLEIDDGTITKP